MAKDIEIWISPDGSRIELLSFNEEGFNIAEVKKWGHGMVTVFSENPRYSAATWWNSVSESWEYFKGPYPESFHAMFLLSGLPPIHKRYLPDE